MNIGLIGLGAMGGAYAKHLLKNIFKCFGIDLDKNNILKFIQLGGQEITYDELFNKVEIVLTSLPSLIAYKDVLNNLKRLGKNNSKKIILDMNTISIDDKSFFAKNVNNNVFMHIDILKNKFYNVDTANTSFPIDGLNSIIKEDTLYAYKKGHFVKKPYRDLIFPSNRVDSSEKRIYLRSIELLNGLGYSSLLILGILINVIY